MEFSRKEEVILLKKVNQLQLASRENQKLRDEVRRLSEGREGREENGVAAVEAEEEVMLEAEASNDVVIQEGQKVYLEKEELVRQEMLEVDKNIEEREKFLERMSRENMKLGSELVSSLNQNYHEKIATLERERKGLLKQREEVSATEKAKFASKIEGL